jgi:hypothetical protein
VLLFFLLEKLLPRVETEVAEAVVSLHHLTLEVAEAAVSLHRSTLGTEAVEAAARSLRPSTLEMEAVEVAVNLHHLTLEVAI